MRGLQAGNQLYLRTGIQITVLEIHSCYSFYKIDYTMPKATQGFGGHPQEKKEKYLLYKLTLTKKATL